MRILRSKKIKFRHAPLLFKYILKGSSAITLYPYVFTKDKYPSSTLVNHERIHVSQIRLDGRIKFYAKYCWEYLVARLKGVSHSKAYHFISYEKEAYDNQHNLYYIVRKK